MSKLGYSQAADGDIVTLTISREDYQLLLLFLGVVVGAAMNRGDEALKHSVLRLANRMNLGNPRWDRYEVPDPSD